MRQIQQNFGSGELGLVDVPMPALRDGGVLVANAFSLISAGTERNTVSTAKKSLLGKARSRPDLVKRVLKVARREGLLETMRMVKNKLDTPLPLGYSCAGYVVAVADDVEGLRIGDKVACAGTGYASHSEIVFAPKNLVARVPDGVPLHAAAYATLGAIALQGVRQAEVSLGDTVAVVGLGLLGQLTVQILKAAGCRVLATDLAEDLVAMARKGGADLALPRAADVERAAREITGGWGVDRVILTASTRSRDPVELAGALCREKGAVVVVGNVNLDVPREIYYRKELDVRLSRSYGPGRYDPRYEEQGIDYPLPYVRWTEQRNLSSFLQLIADGKLDLEVLTTHRFPLEDAERAYRVVTNGERSVGILLRYQAAEAGPGAAARRASVTLAASGAGPVGVSFIGAGSFASNFLLPQLRDADLRRVVTATGLSARAAAEKFRFQEAGTDPAAVFDDENTRAVFIATRHDSHADLVCRALRAGKYVFCEKPLAITPEGLERVKGEIGDGRLMVGFNRRFAPAGGAARDAFAGRTGPLTIHYRVNAPPLPRGHWLCDPQVGGGRILGEVCHFVDFVLFLAGERVRRVFAAGGVAITLELDGGSVATIHYTAAGARGVAKEWVEAIGDGQVVSIDDFAAVTIHRDGRSRRVRGKGRGYREETEAFLAAARAGRPVPAGEDEAVHVTETCFAVLESLRTGEAVHAADSGGD